MGQGGGGPVVICDGALARRLPIGGWGGGCSLNDLVLYLCLRRVVLMACD